MNGNCITAGSYPVPAVRYPVKYDISFMRGDSFAFTMRVRSDSDPIMLGESGMVCWSLFDSLGRPVISKSFGQHSQDRSGFVTLSLLPEETGALSPRVYSHEIEFRFSNELVVTAVKGLVTVNKDRITPAIRESVNVSGT